MAEAKVALFTERNVRFVVVRVDKSFGAKSRAEQQRMIDRMAIDAAMSSLPQLVVPVWDQGGGRIGLRAPQAVRPYLRGLSIAELSERSAATLRTSVEFLRT